jgi:hypothetical protein
VIFHYSKPFQQLHDVLSHSDFGLVSLVAVGSLCQSLAWVCRLTEFEGGVDSGGEGK